MQITPQARVTAICLGVLALGAGAAVALQHRGASRSATRAPAAGGVAQAAAGTPVTVAIPSIRRARTHGRVRTEAAPAGSPPLAPLVPGRPPPPAHPVPPQYSPIAPGAPSDAEIKLELAQMEAINRRLRGGFQMGVASVFTDYGYGLACGGVLGVNQLGVANLTLPCGTPVTFRYGGRQVTVPVLDRGPYIAGRLWDLTGATAAVLNFPGLGEIAWKIG
ncbi:MAG: RlpA-like double-psi beta-barrel domain-containing protein [Solirubrobacteraceae bacterium]